MIDYDAFFDELVKISEDDRYVTKEKLKRLGTTVLPALAIGSALGVGTGKLIKRQVRPDTAIGRAAKKIPKGLLKYGPAVIGATGAAAAALRFKQRKKILEALEGEKK